MNFPHSIFAIEGRFDFYAFDFVFREFPDAIEVIHLQVEFHLPDVFTGPKEMNGEVVFVKNYIGFFVHREFKVQHILKESGRSFEIERRYHGTQVKYFIHRFSFVGEVDINIFKLWSTLSGDSSRFEMLKNLTFSISWHLPRSR